MSKQDNHVESILRIQHFVFNELHFERKGFRQDSEDISTKIGVQVKKTDTNKYTVVLQVTAEKENEYEVQASISGYCEIDDDAPQKDIILQVNAPAILFPYVRAQLSLLTAQPETQPIVLPVINFQQIYELSKKETTSQQSSPSKDL